MTSRDTVAERGGRRGLLIVLGLAVVVLVLDQATKSWAVQTLDATRQPLIGDLLGLRLVRNPGAAFSVGAGATWVFTVLAGVVSVAIVWIARSVRSTWWVLALGLLLGGATGNLGDRLFRMPGFARGHVVDFLELPNWPVFNLADTAICCAAALIILAGLRGVSPDGRPEPR